MNTLAGELAVEGGKVWPTTAFCPRQSVVLGSRPTQRLTKAASSAPADTLQFLTMLQDEFYARYSKAMRDAGYEGEVVSSNWQAGRGFSHLPTCTPMPKLAPLTATITSALRPTPP
jgi:predicted nucleic acid-binding Zn ribbon protein